MVYKLPAQSGPGVAAQKGLQYKYLDEASGGWRDGVGTIDKLMGAVGRSLLPLYQNNSQVKGCQTEPAVGGRGEASKKGLACRGNFMSYCPSPPARLPTLQ